LSVRAEWIVEFMNLVGLYERHARHYTDDWWFLTYLGWSHAENDNAATGRRTTERAFESRRENANAVNALAHAMFEDGSTADGQVTPITDNKRRTA
jgi:hypothetical protein